ncbi:MAG: carboxylating nicotinate-nucleotide diphosphorylase [Planctomycetota bacterium]|nr:carboxylating nicotinate-nucleotide diphosphorylase [Planctomycetota bacterium]
MAPSRPSTTEDDSSSLTEALGPDGLRSLVAEAIEEDLGDGDLTSSTAVPLGAKVTARLVAKASGTLAGLELFREAFLVCDGSATIELLATDGDAVEPGQEVARVTGDARAILVAERTALNFLQQLSGVATLTAAYVQRAGGRARILDTRKTTPLLRLLQKYAVICGGGENHRFGLFDEAMIKDNHTDLAGVGLEELTRSVRGQLGEGIRITSEARDAEEAQGAVRGGADVVLLDNMSPKEMAALVPGLRALAAGRGRPIELEASGCVGLEGVEAVSRTGVDRISVGALTHSAPALDLSLLVEVQA